MREAHVLAEDTGLVQHEERMQVGHTAQVHCFAENDLREKIRRRGYDQSCSGAYNSFCDCKTCASFFGHFCTHVFYDFGLET